MDTIKAVLFELSGGILVIVMGCALAFLGVPGDTIGYVMMGIAVGGTILLGCRYYKEERNGKRNRQ